mmetsp:Transcript_63547/g.138394  ORF Transcript_63547/g.138394 Transcript_63547/m.138394 type:complete len:430 (+) Transcript_63547:46-1335(+)|eukprot:CAMPEP_0170617874 /NCGR_PEP_ID=MMETSP0224-20130122/26656_1 /TAXON_ID=285029 /ORGANISM="Togula jolla, Strain CCCM 725" /LENGTH=429 /DNA_ID=CAMNT_0010943807 /DNA_START=43 /DNA_END=1332 /DNA_ORIENTATION=+
MAVVERMEHAVKHLQEVAEEYTKHEHMEGTGPKQSEQPEELKKQATPETEPEMEPHGTHPVTDGPTPTSESPEAGVERATVQPKAASEAHGQPSSAKAPPFFDPSTLEEQVPQQPQGGLLSSLRSMVAEAHRKASGVVEDVSARIDQAKTTTSDFAESIVVAALAYADYTRVVCRRTVNEVEAVVSQAVGRVHAVGAHAYAVVSSTSASAYSIGQSAYAKGPRRCVTDVATGSYEMAAATADWGKARAIEKKNVALESASCAVQTARTRGSDAAEKVVATAASIGSQAREVASDGKFQVTAIAGAGGAAAGGATGGAAGLVAGAASGAALGVIPAVFTLGLSIPVGAVIGGGAGLIAGTAAGGTLGAAAAGAIGYRNEKDIQHAVGQARDTVSACAESAKCRTSASAAYVKCRVSAVKARLVGSSGETA